MRHWCRAAALALLLLVGVAGDVAPLATEGDDEAWLAERTAAYCRAGQAAVGALNEGRPPRGLIKPKLAHVHVVMRHGDRSAIYSSAPTPGWACGRPSLQDSYWVHNIVAAVPSTMSCVSPLLIPQLCYLTRPALGRGSGPRRRAAAKNKEGRMPDPDLDTFTSALEEEATGAGDPHAAAEAMKAEMAASRSRSGGRPVKPSGKFRPEGLGPSGRRGRRLLSTGSAALDLNFGAPPPPGAVTPLIKAALSGWTKRRLNATSGGGTCGNGELTTVGYGQAHAVGAALGSVGAYIDLVHPHTAAGGSPAEASIEVEVDGDGTGAAAAAAARSRALRPRVPWGGLVSHSTDTGRTVLTASAFLQGFAEASGHMPPYPLTPEEAAAGVTPPSPPLGVGSTIPLHVLSRADDFVMAPVHWNLTQRCPRAASTRASADAALLSSAAHGAIEGSLAAAILAAGGGLPDTTHGATPGSLRPPTTEELADDLFTRLCHGMPLPCWAPANATEAAAASVVCMTPAQARAVIAAADAYYERRYGDDTSRLLLAPFLQHMAGHMRARLTALAHAADPAVAEAAGPSESNAPHAPPFIIRAAHDTVIAPLLSALGLRSRRHAWPGYASRVVTELWTDAASAAYVRVLYNGEDITPATTCADAAGLCTLEAFEALAASLLGPYPTFPDACTAP